ncbi:hypothetical protein [Acinetobacter junii]|uniref:hypothetical protein n=1 Tax=Acinetobacter junii TaxID=40215 RepID=UPI00124FAA1C|nr:hypothetical protein [Acinetobacter junii]
MEQLNQEVQKDAQPSALRQKLNHATNVAAVALGTAMASGITMAAQENTIEIGTLAITGITGAAAAVFAIKASPSLMMWGYRKILGFIGR